MIQHLKKFADYLDLGKKLAQTILVIGPALTILGAAGTWTVKTIYHKEFEKAQAVYNFMQLAQDSIVPSSLRVHSYLKNAVEKLELKHNGSYAIGLRWDEDQQKVMYRGTDKILREAHQSRVDGSWYYIKDDQPYYVYE